MKNILCIVLLACTFLPTAFGCGYLDRGVAKYDSLVEKDEVCNEKWANYEAQLQRRSDLVPNLVEVAKGYATHEKETLEKVIQARASATQIKISTEDQTDPEKMKRFQEAQKELQSSLSRLLLVQEKYPDLKANQHFHDLMIQVEGTENRILRAREEYNKSVKDYNLDLRRVSGKAINPVTGYEFKPRVFFAADDSAKTAPKINFGTPESKQ